MLSGVDVFGAVVGVRSLAMALLVLAPASKTSLSWLFSGRMQVV